MNDLASRIENRLQGLTLDPLSSREITRLLTLETASVLKRESLGSVVFEYPCPRPVVSSVSGKSRSGFFDIVVVDTKGIRVAIEIDRANKKFSRDKLLSVVGPGVTCIWVRWTRTWHRGLDEVHRGIHVISLSATGNSVKEPADKQRSGGNGMGQKSEVTVWLTEPLDGKDPATEEIIKANRHRAIADKVIQDSKTTVVIDDHGSILFDFPTKNVDRISWLSETEQQTTSRSVGRNPSGSKVSREDVKASHPRAYEAWSEDEDQQLVAERNQGMSIQAMARRHQRQPSAIKSRLRKLLGLS